MSDVRFSLVTAVYNVAKYLPDFIASIEAQTFRLDRVEVIAVDDGSDDDSLALLKEWQSRRPQLVVVLSKENGGPGSARNLGLTHASGEWVTFADADDRLDPAYLAAVDEFLQRRAAVSVVAANRLLLSDETGDVLDEDPLRHLFGEVDKVVDLQRYPEYFHGSVSAGFFRNEAIRKYELRFDERIRPSFEDVHFCVQYLLATGQTRVGFLSSARYLHRQRPASAAHGSSNERDAGLHRDVPRLGYLDLLRRSSASDGRPPQWLQNLVIYHLGWYFTNDVAISSPTIARGAMAAEFLDILREIVRYLDPVVIESFGPGRFDRVWRDILIHGLKDEPWSTPYAVLDAYDPVKELARVAYRYVGDQPEEVIQVRGRRVKPTHGKIRSHVYFEQALIKERIAWVRTDGPLRVLLDGTPVEFRADWPGRAMTSLRPAQRERLLETVPPPPPIEPLERRDRLVRALARSRPVRRFFGTAWVLLDRLHNADDNAERLFRYLRKHRRNINAWFVLEKGTPDWGRLRADGYKRVVPHGSLRWELLMLNCAHLISSHTDVEVNSPPAIMRLQPEPWRFTFLQHGVIKDDLSRWLNRKSIDVFVTSTPAEHESIVGDETPYVFTTYEVKMTGLPRFDRLRELGSRTKVAQRTYLLVCPTWRHWLTSGKLAGTHRRDVVKDFLDTEYARMWLGLLRDQRLRELAERERLVIGFMPHPNIQPVLEDLNLPSHVTPLRFAGEDVQQTIARAALMVTDYSSMAFNAAYIDRPVVYFQFDADAMRGGGHVGRRGYFDYVEHGFGPVTETVDQAIAAVDAALRHGRAPLPDYAQRIRATFPNRDGRCCERVVRAIEDLDRPAPSR